MRNYRKELGLPHSLHMHKEWKDQGVLKIFDLRKDSYYIYSCESNDVIVPRGTLVSR